MPQIRADPRIMPLRLFDDKWHPFADPFVSNASLAEHEPDDVAVEHAGDRNALGRDRTSGSEAGGMLQSLTVVRASFRQQRAVNVKQEKWFGGNQLFR